MSHTNAFPELDLPHPYVLKPTTDGLPIPVTQFGMIRYHMISLKCLFVDIWPGSQSCTINVIVETIYFCKDSNGLHLIQGVPSQLQQRIGISHLLKTKIYKRF